MDATNLLGTSKSKTIGGHGIPLVARIVLALALGIIAGLVLHDKAAMFKPFSAVVLRLLGALATPLILLAVVQSILKTKATGKTGLRLAALLLTNSVVAIFIGLLVTNILQPGHHSSVLIKTTPLSQKPFDPLDDLLGKIPGSFLKPLVENDVMPVILIALAVGIGLRKIRQQSRNLEQTALPAIERFLATAVDLMMILLHWVLALVPLAVFGVVAEKVGKEGFQAFLPLVWFIAAVLLALLLQSLYYLLRIRVGSWVRPLDFLRGGAEAFAMAFSTASSAATLPVTFRCAHEKIGVREDSASLGIMVGGAFNHDGTALYEAMAALFISQLLGHHLGFGQQLLVVLMAVMASIGAAGIPEAGLVTLMAVFHAVHLPVEYIPMLLVVDWFLDRCRTTINVMGDMSVTCILDGPRRADTAPEAEDAANAILPTPE